VKLGDTAVNEWRTETSWPRSSASLLLFVSTSIASAAFAQEIDSTRNRTAVAGAVTVTNNGISTIPSFTLGKPAAIFDVSIARHGLSFEPQFRYGLDGKPWTFLFWGRYKLLEGEKLNVTIGGHPALNFKSTSVLVNQIPKEVIVARRYVAGELYPSYSFSRNVSVGAYYLYSHGVEPDATKNTHFLALRTTVSGIRLSEDYFMRFAPQAYYLKADARDGFYLNSGLTVARRNLPLSIAAQVNKTIRTRIVEGEDFIWNVSASYAIR
jgi:hypothetical protein